MNIPFEIWVITLSVSVTILITMFRSRSLFPLPAWIVILFIFLATVVGLTQSVVTTAHEWMYL
jgi:hypothetical protein